MKEYTITLNIDELKIVGSGLQGVAYQHAAPVINKIESQINTQIRAENEAAEAAKVAEVAAAIEKAKVGE